MPAHTAASTTAAIYDHVSYMAEHMTIDTSIYWHGCTRATSYQS